MIGKNKELNVAFLTDKFIIIPVIKLAPHQILFKDRIKTKLPVYAGLVLPTVNNKN